MKEKLSGISISQRLTLLGFLKKIRLKKPVTDLNGLEITSISKPASSQ